MEGIILAVVAAIVLNFLVYPFFSKIWKKTKDKTFGEKAVNVSVEQNDGMKLISFDNVRVRVPNGSVEGLSDKGNSPAKVLVRYFERSFISIDFTARRRDKFTEADIKTNEDMLKLGREDTGWKFLGEESLSSSIKIYTFDLVSSPGKPVYIAIVSYLDIDSDFFGTMEIEFQFEPNAAYNKQTLIDIINSITT